MRNVSKMFDTSSFRKLNLFFFAFNFVYFCGFSTYFGFITIYLANHGYSSFECGIVNTVIAICLLLFQPLCGYITDTFLSVKKFLILCSVGTILTIFILPAIVEHSFMVVILSVLPIALLYQSMTFLADSWVVGLREDYPYIDYGKSRTGGSTGGAVTNVAAGFLIAQFGYIALFVVTALAAVALIFIISQIPDIPCKNKAGQHQKENESVERLSFVAVFRELLKIHPYVIFVVATTVCGFGWRAVYANLTFKVLDLGGGDVELGIANAICAIAEIPVLLLVTFACRKMRLHYLLLFSMVFAVLRGLTFWAADGMTMLYLSQICQSCSYGLMVSISLELINKLVPATYRATAITIMISATGGLGALAGNFFGGFLVNLVGVNQMAAYMLIPTAVPALLYGCYILHQRYKCPETLL